MRGLQSPHELFTCAGRNLRGRLSFAAEALVILASSLELGVETHGRIDVHSVGRHLFHERDQIAGHVVDLIQALGLGSTDTLVT